MKTARFAYAGRAVLLEVHNFVGFLHFFIEELHVGELADIVFIHTVDGKALASGNENALTEIKYFCLLSYRELFAVAV